MQGKEIPADLFFKRIFHPDIHGDKAHKVIGDADALSALAVALVGGFNVDALDNLSQSIGGVSSSKSSYLCTR